MGNDAHNGAHNGPNHASSPLRLPPREQLAAQEQLGHGAHSQAGMRAHVRKDQQPPAHGRHRRQLTLVLELHAKLHGRWNGVSGAPHVPRLEDDAGTLVRDSA